MSNAPILFKVKDLVGLITLNRPDNRNSMDSETMPALMEAHYQSRTFEREDAREGIMELLEKRAPVFHGR